MIKNLIYFLCTLLPISGHMNGYKHFVIRQGTKPRLGVFLYSSDKVRQIIKKRHISIYLIKKTPTYSNAIGDKKDDKHDISMRVIPFIISNDSLSGMYVIDLRLIKGFSAHSSTRPYGIAFILNKEVYFFDDDSLKNIEWLSKHDSLVHQILDGQNFYHGKYEDYIDELKKGTLYLRD